MKHNFCYKENYDRRNGFGMNDIKSKFYIFIMKGTVFIGQNSYSRS